MVNFRFPRVDSSLESGCAMNQSETLPVCHQEQYNKCVDIERKVLNIQLVMHPYVETAEERSQRL